MSERNPRLEDSVVMSIGQVRDMLRDEVRPEPAQAPGVPVAIPVKRSELEVPSMAEVKASREARWASEERATLPLVSTRRSRAWIWPAALVLVAAGAFWFGQSRGEPDFAFVPATELDEARAETARVQKARDDEAQRAAALATEAVALKAQIAKLEAAAASAPEAAPEVAKADEAAKPAKKRARKRSSARRLSQAERPRKRRKVRRRPKRLTRNDKALDSLIEGL